MLFTEFVSMLNRAGKFQIIRQILPLKYFLSNEINENVPVQKKSNITISQ